MANRTFNNVKMNVTLKTQSTRANLLSTSEDIAVQMGKIQKWYTDFAWSAFTAPTVSVTGTGNAVTTASFNTSTGLLTLTKGKTFVTSAESRTILSDLLTDTEFIDAARKDTHIDVAANALSGAPKAVGIYAIGMRSMEGLSVDDVTDFRIIGDRDHLLYHVGYLYKDGYIRYTDFASLLTPADVTGTSGITVTLVNSNSVSQKVRPIATYPCGVQIGHSNSITAGTASGSATKTLTFGDTFTIPTVTYDANGHITATGVTTMTMPDNPNTDARVYQSKSTYTSFRPLLMGSNNSTTPANLETAVTGQTYVNAALYCQPSTGSIYTAGNIYLTSSPAAINFVDSSNTTYGAISENSSGNLWIGSREQNTHHHTGRTYISAGYDSTNQVGYSTIRVAVPNAANTSASIFDVWHSGNTYQVIPNEQAGTWEDVGIPLTTDRAFKLIRAGNGTNASYPPDWFGGSAYRYGSGIAIGVSDTAALIAFRSNRMNTIPHITCAGGGRGSDYSSALSSEPADWQWNYTNYYTRSGTDPDYEYTPVPAGTSAPTFAANTYYLSYSKPTWYFSITGKNKSVYDLDNLQATSLSTNAGSNINPVYFTGGIPTACTMTASGAYWPALTYVKSDGTLDIGGYLDFHRSSSDTSNYYYRIYTDSTGVRFIGGSSLGDNNVVTMTAPKMNQIRFITSDSTTGSTVTGIRVHALDSNGSTGLIQFQGNTVIASGSFATNAYGRKDSTGTDAVGYDDMAVTNNEKLYLGSDTDVQIVTNGQNIGTYNNTSHKVWNFGNDGRLSVPGPIFSIPAAETAGVSPFIIQNTKSVSTSSYVTLARWYRGGASMGAYGGLIGFHNTGGDTTDKGAIILVPYETDTYPWNKTTGLYIGKNMLMLGGVDVPRVTETWTEAMIGTLPAGSANPIDSSNLIMESIGTPGLYNRKPALMLYKYLNERDFATYYNADSTYSSTSWCKLAELPINGASTHRGNVFIVSENFGSSTTNYRAWGILAFAGSTTSTGTYSAATLQWLVASSGIKKDCFALTYNTTVPTFDTSKYYWTANSGGTQVTSQPADWETNCTSYYVSTTSSGTRSRVTWVTTFQIWAKAYVRYNGWILKSLYGAGASISAPNYDWIYYRSTGSSAVANYEGTLIMYSKVAGILNAPTQEDAVANDANPQPLIYESATNTAPPIEIEVSGLFTTWRLVLIVCKQFLYTSSSGASLSALIPLERVKKLGTSPGTNVFKIPLPYTASNNTKGLNSLTITYVNDNKFTVDVDLESGKSSIGAGEYKLYGIY